MSNVATDNLRKRERKKEFLLESAEPAQGLLAKNESETLALT